MSRPGTTLFLMSALAAVIMPVAVDRPTAAASALAFPGWPTMFEGRPIAPLPPAGFDERLRRQFAGQMRRFSDGERQIVLRWVSGPTRLLHPAATCFRNSGYAVAPAAMRRAASGEAMSCFRADKGGKSLVACERIFESAGRSWPDPSAWYWHALLNPAPGGYWAVLQVEAEPNPD